MSTLAANILKATAGVVTEVEAQAQNTTTATDVANTASIPTQHQLPSNVISTSTQYETQAELDVVSASKHALHDSNEFLYDYTSSACV